MLEQSLRVVEACLESHKNGHLSSIKNMRGFIASHIGSESAAYLELQITAGKKELYIWQSNQSAKIIELYEEALHRAYLKGPFYDGT